MAERTGGTESSKSVGRRDFIKDLTMKAVGLIAADSIISHTPPLASERFGFTRDLWEKLETGAWEESKEGLKKRIQGGFGVEVVGPSEGVTKLTLETISNNLTRVETLDWDTPQLKLLALTLKVLPKKFTQPQKIKDKHVRLKVALYEKSLIHNILPGDSGSACMGCDTKSAAPTVVFDKAILGTTIGAGENGKKVIVHELTHYVTDQDMERYTKRIAQPLGINTTEDLWKVFASEITIKRELQEEPNRPAIDRTRVISWNSNIGYGARNIKEFFSIAAEYYVGGKENFVNAYKPFLGEDKAGFFYERMKQEIFERKEY